MLELRLAVVLALGLVRAPYHTHGLVIVGIRDDESDPHRTVIADGQTSCGVIVAELDLIEGLPQRPGKR